MSKFDFGSGGQEMEDDIGRASGMLDDGEDSGDGATKVGRIKGHGDVGRERVTEGGRRMVRRQAFDAIMESRSFFEGGSGSNKW